MASRPDPQITIEELVSSRPLLAPLLARLELFCRTHRTLAQACVDAEIDYDELAALIEAEGHG